jgi:hypothetical protein
MSDYKSETLAPGIELYDNIVEDCAEFIELALSKEGWRDSTFFTPTETNKVDKSVRNTKILDLPYHLEGEIEWFVLSKMFKSVADDYSAKWRCGYQQMEHPQLLHYTKGEGHYDYHADAGPGTIRTFSAILYLNEVEEGGETHFQHFDLKISPKAGRLAMFPADYPYVHAALPPLSGDKFAIVTWFRPWMYAPSQDQGQGHNHLPH